MKLIMADGRELSAPDPLPIDIVMMERKFNMDAGDMGTRVDYALFLAWHATKRTQPNAVPTKYDDFLAQLTDFEGDEEDPTEAEPAQNDS